MQAWLPKLKYKKCQVQYLLNFFLTLLENLGLMKKNPKAGKNIQNNYKKLVKNEEKGKFLKTNVHLVHHFTT